MKIKDKLESINSPDVRFLLETLDEDLTVMNTLEAVLEHLVRKHDIVNTEHFVNEAIVRWHPKF